MLQIQQLVYLLILCSDLQPPACTAIQFFVLRDYARETLSLRWRSWMTSYYMKRYFKNRTFYKIQSQSLIDNPDQRINDDLSAFTGTALAFSLTLLNAVVDLVSFSNILYGIYPPLFIVLIVYSLGGTAISVFLGKVRLLPALFIYNLNQNRYNCSHSFIIHVTNSWSCLC